MRMKIKTFMFAALAAFATLFAGCSDDENKTNGDITGGDPVESEYKVTFSDTSYYSSVATFEAITENAKSQSFMAVVFETAFLEQQIPGITDNDIAKGVINYYKAEYMSQGVTVADIYNVITLQGQLHGSVTPLELDVPGLSAGTSYSVVVAGINENLEIVANGIVAEFTTKTLPGLEEENCTFEWTVEPKSTSVTMSFTPSDKEVPYFFYALTAEEYSSECQNDPAILKELLPSFIANLAKAYQMSVSEFMEKQRMTGDLEEFTLTGLLPKTGYVVFVCGMDEYGRPTTDVSVKDFETLEYVASDATVESVDVRLYDGEEASSIDPTTYKPDSGSIVRLCVSDCGCRNADAWRISRIFQDGIKGLNTKEMRVCDEKVKTQMAVDGQPDGTVGDAASYDGACSRRRGSKACHVCHILGAGSPDCGDCSGIDYKGSVQFPVCWYFNRRCFLVRVPV